MGGRLDPAVARTRVAVRASLADLDPGDLVLVGCSGGADSLALVAACCFEGPKAGLAVGAVVVDHGLQDGSAQVAARAGECAAALGADPVRVERVLVGPEGGPEAAARAARYAALHRVADELDARALLLAHTRDDQAETVLLGLARGSGTRSLAGMRPVSGRLRRPLLGLTHDDTVQACAGAGRRLVGRPAQRRQRPHPGPGSAHRAAGAGGRARAGRARRAGPQSPTCSAPTPTRWTGWPTCCSHRASDGSGLRVETLAGAPAALRHRALRTAARRCRLPGRGPDRRRTCTRVDALVTDWHGQRGVDLPGRVRAERAAGVLRLAAAGVTG